MTEADKACTVSRVHQQKSFPEVAISIAVILSLKAQGADSIISSEPSPARAVEAKDARAIHAFNPTKEEVKAKYYKFCDGKSGHVIFQCGGVETAMDTSTDSVRRKGTIVNIAKFVEPNNDKREPDQQKESHLCRIQCQYRRRIS